MKKLLSVIFACIVLTCCILAAGCVSSTPASPQVASQTPAGTSSDAVWTATEYDDGIEEQRIMIFHTDGTGEKKTDKGYKISDLRTFTWIQPDNRHFICTFEDGDIDTFTLTDNGKLTHDGKYYTCTQAGSLPQISTPVAKPQDHPEIIGTWETYELDKKGIETKTLEFKADGTGIKTKIKAKGSVTVSPFIWEPIGPYYLITYPIDEDDDTVHIVDGKLDHDGEMFVKT